MDARAVVVSGCRRRGLGTVEHLRRRSGGELSEVYEVRTTTDPRPLIVKLYAPEWAWKQRKEVHVYGLLEPVLPGLVPRVLDVWEPGEAGEPASTVMTCRPGVPLSEVAATLDASTLRRLYGQVGEAARAVHSVRQDAFGYLVEGVVDPLPDLAGYVRSRFTAKLAALAGTGDPADLSPAIEQRLDAAGPALTDPVAPVVCHNDLHEGNLLVDDRSGSWTLTGVVDVENAVAADPLQDLAKLDLYAVRGDPARAVGLAEGYGVDLDPAARVRVDLYRIYHALELLTWFREVGQPQRAEGLVRQLEELLGRPSGAAGEGGTRAD